MPIKSGPCNKRGSVHSQSNYLVRFSVGNCGALVVWGSERGSADVICGGQQVACQSAKATATPVQCSATDLDCAQLLVNVV